MPKTPKPATATASPAALWTEAEAARYLSLTIRSLQSWRLRGGGPPFRKLGRRLVRYHPETVIAWAARDARITTRQKVPA